MHWDFAIILVVLGVLVPWLGRRRVRYLIDLPSTSQLDRLALYASTMAFQWTTAAIIVWRARAHRVSLKQLGLAIPHSTLTVTTAILLCTLFFANQIISLKRAGSRPMERTGILRHLATKVFPQSWVERLAFFALVATVAICEELIYRGFIQGLLQNWTGLVLLGIILSAVFFGLAHFYQGLQGLASTFIVGLVFAAVRSWTGSLIPSVAAHFVTDLTVGILAPIRLRTVNITTVANSDDTEPSTDS